jgi:hypothetical protein
LRHLRRAILSISFKDFFSSQPEQVLLGSIFDKKLLHTKNGGLLGDAFVYRINQKELIVTTGEVENALY